MGLSGDTRRSYYDPDAGPRRWAVTSAFAGNGVAIAGLGNGVTIASVAMRTPSPKAP
jgi:hypothetical protein